MNLQQFHALSEGDEVENTLTHSVGRVTKIEHGHVHVGWGGNHLTFAYGPNSTAWFHWTLVAGNRDARNVADGGQSHGGHM